MNKNSEEGEGGKGGREKGEGEIESENKIGRRVERGKGYTPACPQ